ncbi:MAG TPA: hypothetical protein VNT30_02870 [Stellaceae bacterium]|nr:hypothetical protein [Stellaceae bacterium]
MGGLLLDHYVPGVLNDLNLRFSPGDGIREIIALQKEFKMFSPDHSLRSAFALLSIGPLENWRTRRAWSKYLDLLRNLPSDTPGQNAHDYLAELLERHLAQEEVLPVHFTSHSTLTHPALMAEDATLAISYSYQGYLTISLPMTPATPDRVRRQVEREQRALRELELI